MPKTDYMVRIRETLPEKKVTLVGLRITKKIHSKKETFIQTKGRTVGDIKQKLQKLITMVVIREIQVALGEHKEVLEERIEEIEAYDIKKSGLGQDMHGSQVKTQRYVQDTKKVMGELMDILGEELKTVDQADTRDLD